ncbi:hypothetical protein EUGRSUZ_B02103, partial [Eucalyptus grandis]
SYVEGLKNEVKELETARKRVQRSVDEARYDGKRVYIDVEDWLESVKKQAEEAGNLLKHGESANNACFHGWLPNPKGRRLIGRKVKKMTNVIQRLHKKSTSSYFQKVYYEDTPTGIVTATTSTTRFVDNKEDVLESRAKIAEDVIKAIADDNVSVIGVHGPGGVGKSKLLEDVERRVREAKMFDVVAKARVLQNPDLKTIQDNITYALGLKLKNEETTSVRADRLYKRLKSDPQKNILIILDDLWKKLELKEVGIPCGYDNKIKGCKLLLASRDRGILRTDMNSDRAFRVNELEKGEVQRLFERTVGDIVNNPEYKPWVDGVIEKCGGLPLLIVSSAKRLNHGDLVAWRNASTNIDELFVKSIVERNYDDLKDNLATRSKRLGIDRDDMERFGMHDIFVDVAISVASKEWNALVGRNDSGFKEWSKDELRKCTAMSFPHVGINELPEKLDCPNLRMLLLLERNRFLKVPESFLESMEKLEVLDFSDFYFTSLPSSIESLENLKSLCLDRCYIEDVAILEKLKQLQFLSFIGSTIFRLPKEIGSLTELRFLDLTWCERLRVIEPVVLGSLVNLEELYMEDSFDQWASEDDALPSNASVAELKNMKKLRTLHIAIPRSANLSGDLPFGKLNKHKIQIGDIWDWSGEYEQSRTLKLKLDSGNLLNEEWVQRCFHRTQDLYLDGMQDGGNSIHDLCVEGFQELKHLHVQSGPSFQYVAHSPENVTTFTKLESLFLRNLSNLEKIYRGSLAPESFNKLKSVKMDNCGKIKYLFPLSMMRVFLQLEEIEMNRCHLIHQIVANAEVDETGIEIIDYIICDPKVKSCNLRRLTLRNLPELTSFYKTEDHSGILFDGQQ